MPGYVTAPLPRAYQGHQALFERFLDSSEEAQITERTALNGERTNRPGANLPSMRLPSTSRHLYPTPKGRTGRSPAGVPAVRGARHDVGKSDRTGFATTCQLSIE